MLLYVMQLSWQLARSMARPRLGPLEESRIKMRVWPFDLDTNLHMNNGRYFTLMDYGRFDMVVRNGLGRAVLRHKWAPVVASSMIRYRRSLMPFESYELCTRIVCWDERWFYMEQRFERAGDVAAQAWLRGTFKQGRETVPMHRLLAAIGATVESPPMPAALQRWREAEDAARSPVT